MIIFVGGLIGTGKSSLAKALAEKLGAYYYDVDKIKKEVYPTDPDYEYNMANSIPFSNETRIRTFNRVVEDFPKLATQHKYIVVDETLHKKSLREILFEGAKKYAGGYIVVWVKADESVIRERLTKDKREGHILKDSFGMYLSLKKIFEDINEADVIVENNGSISESLDVLVKLVTEKI